MEGNKILSMNNKGPFSNHRHFLLPKQKLFLFLLSSIFVCPHPRTTGPMLCHAPEIEPIILFSAPTSDVGGYFGSDSTERGHAISHFRIRLVIKIASSLLFVAGRLESVSNKAKDFIIILVYSIRMYPGHARTAPVRRSSSCYEGHR